MLRRDPLMVALDSSVAWALHSLLDEISVSVACVVVTSRRDSWADSVLTGRLIRSGPGSGADLASVEWQALLDHLGAMPPTLDHSVVARELSQCAPFASAGPINTRVIHRPPLTAFLLVGNHSRLDMRELHGPALLECVRRIVAALDGYTTCRVARTRGHELAFVGASCGFLDLERDIKQAASLGDLPVLITGERGAGKEATAYAIHHHSPRRHRPFVVINSAALHPELYAAELFGCRRGAFTGATDDRIGRFEAADGGTIFFDEITEMPPQLYAGLLRAFDHGEIQKLGDTRVCRTNVRIIAATNRNLASAVQGGRFPADLYDRISALKVSVPALRTRKADVALLASVFLRQFCGSTGNGHNVPSTTCAACATSRVAACLDQDAVATLTAYAWPGNVRELKNVITRVRALTPDARIRAASLPPEIRSSRDVVSTAAADGRLETAIRLHILRTLERTAWNKSAAARALGIPLSTLVSKMKRLKLPQRPLCGNAVADRGGSA